MTTYSSLPNKLASPVNGIDYAYRDAGEGPVPLVLLQHFRGNLDNWDPALIDALASTRRVVAFDNAGVGGSTGTTPHVIEQMAHDAIAFLAALEFGQADLLYSALGPPQSTRPGNSWILLGLQDERPAPPADKASRRHRRVASLNAAE